MLGLSGSTHHQAIDLQCRSLSSRLHCNSSARIKFILFKKTAFFVASHLWRPLGIENLAALIFRSFQLRKPFGEFAVPAMKRLKAFVTPDVTLDSRGLGDTSTGVSRPKYSGFPQLVLPRPPRTNASCMPPSCGIDQMRGRLNQRPNLNKRLLESSTLF